MGFQLCSGCICSYINSQPYKVLTIIKTSLTLIPSRDDGLPDLSQKQYFINALRVSLMQRNTASNQTLIQTWWSVTASSREEMYSVPSVGSKMRNA